MGGWGSKSCLVKRLCQILKTWFGKRPPIALLYFLSWPTCDEEASKYVDRLGRVGEGEGDMGEIFVCLQLKHLPPSSPSIVLTCSRGATCGVILAGHSSANLNLVQDLSPNELPLPPATARLLVRVGFLKNQFQNCSFFLGYIAI